jgi:nucleotide-binding universal stress UspA family protein
VSAERRILVGVHGSLGSLQALRYATAEARKLKVRLVPVIAWVPPGGDLAERRQPVYSLRTVWREAARERLLDSFDRALGGIPADLEVAPEVIRGPAGAVLTDAASRPGDLLVVGTGRRGGLRRIRRSVSRYCLAHAHCPVIAVPPSDLMEAASRGLHLWPRKDGAPALGHPDAWLRRTSSG